MVQLLNVCSALAEVLSLHTIFHIRRLTTTSNSISRGSNTSGLLSHVHSHMSIHKLNKKSILDTFKRKELNGFIGQLLTAVL